MQDLKRQCAQAIGFSFQCWYADLLRELNNSGWPKDSADNLDTINNLGRGSRIRVSLDTLLKNASTQKLSNWAIQLFLAQARCYLNSPSPRAKARMRVQQALYRDTRILIKPYLGSVVAWESLIRHTFHVHRLIAIGSALALPWVTNNKLQPVLVSGLLARPKIRRWVNIVNVAHWIADPNSLDGQPDGTVEDYLIEHDEEPHEIQSYLRRAPLIHSVVDTLQTLPETLRHEQR